MSDLFDFRGDLVGGGGIRVNPVFERFKALLCGFVELVERGSNRLLFTFVNELHHQQGADHTCCRPEQSCCHGISPTLYLAANSAGGEFQIRSPPAIFPDSFVCVEQVRRGLGSLPASSPGPLWHRAGRGDQRESYER